MLKQTIVWTALPHRRAGNTLRLSVFVAPRLWSTDSDATLKLNAFPDFLDWPSIVRLATFQVEFAGGLKLPATISPAQTFRSDLWTALFKNDTDVVPFAFEDFTGVPVVSFSAATLHDHIRGVYQEFATKHGSELPSRDVIGSNTAIVDIARPRDEARPFVPPRKPDPVFVGTPGPELPDEIPTTPPAKAKPGCDGCGCGCLAAPFALLRRLLKRLGMFAALPFTMGGGGVGGSAGGSGGGAGAVPMTASRAEYERLQSFVKPQSEVSQPMPSAAQLKDTYDFHRMVASLGDHPTLLRFFGLVVDLEVTLDAALPAPTGTVKVIPTVTTTMPTTHYSPRTHYTLDADRFLTRERPGGDLHDGLLRVHEPGRFRLLQLDVAGSAIKLQNMATKLVNEQRHKSAPRNDPEEQGLPALQTAGFSIVRSNLAFELREAFARSYSLNKALAAIDLSPLKLATLPVQPPAADELFADDVLRGYRVDVLDDRSARWHSLCQRVGEYTVAGTPLPPIDDEGFVQPAVTESLDKTKPRELRIGESLFTWSGWSLAAPRYGKTIDPEVGPDHRSRVMEPSNAPATRFDFRTKFTPKKKSLPRLRYGYSYQLRVRAADLAGNSVIDPAEAFAFQVTPAEVTPLTKYCRFEPVAPPVVVLQKKPVEGESLERLVVRSIFDNTPSPVDVRSTERHLAAPKTSQPMAEQHRKFDRTDDVDGTSTGYDLAARESGILPGDIIPALFTLEYLPDPYARGVLLLGLPGEAGGETRIEFEGTWPDPEPFLLHVDGIAKNVAPAAPKWEPAARLLTVQVPQGETYPVRISSWFLAADLDNMAIWDWMALTGVVDLPALRAAAEAGRNWLHAPWRTLVLVHAVQQPLEIPKMTGVDASARKLGNTIAPLKVSIDIDAKSTQKLDLHATWADPIDTPGAPTGFENVPHSMQVAELEVLNPGKNAFTAEVPHAFGDTKHHLVTYTPIGSSRFREYFPATDPIRSNLVRPTSTESPLPLAEHIPSSARPAAPKPLYLLPLFEWTRGGTPTQPTATRKGAGFRVYLERGWFSSGAGELLGIVLRPSSTGVNSTDAGLLRKYTSEWGMDPLWSSVPTAPMSRANFKDFVAPQPGEKIRLAEIEHDVDVIGYEVHFDPERELWYCDILLDPGATYFPMVRFALVRFQPHSIEGAHISPVVLADFVQVVPHREVAYDARQAANGVIAVEVSGPAFVHGQRFVVTPRMLLRLEMQSALGAAGELSWTPIATAEMQAVAPQPEHTVWTGLVRTGITPVPKPLRVVVLELEPYRVDERGPSDALEIIVDAAASDFGHRVTFTDALELP